MNGTCQRLNAPGAHTRAPLFPSREPDHATRMRATELMTGRQFVVALDHGEDFFATLESFCAQRGVRAGYIPMFIGGFRSARLVGTCKPLTDPEAPVWDEIEVELLEVVGAGTIAWDAANDRPSPHVHVTTGLRADAAHARTSHLFGAEVQFITELVIVEVLSPALTRPRVPEMYDAPLLSFEAGG
jgi:predicted DNA-binding protein with PD1-like motif